VPASKKTSQADKRLAPIHARGMMPPVPPRQAVANEIRERIRSGVYKPGETIPSIPELVSITTGAAKNTIIAALKILQEEGYVKSLHGIGTYVLTPEYWGNAPE
jgi:DNA-binding GntR family transcriptional regulator